MSRCSSASAGRFSRLPGGFLPVDDQGFITIDVQTPPEASFSRTLEAVKSVEEYLLKRPGVDKVTFLTGFSFLGQGVNTAQAFITLKHWSERGADDSAEHIVADVNQQARAVPRCQDHRAAAAADRQSRQFVRLQLPPPGSRPERLRRIDAAPRTSCSRRPQRSPVLQDVFVEGLSPAPQVELNIDREKAAALGVTFEEINNTISTNLGSAYVNDFPNRGRMQRVIVQADRPRACRPRNPELQRAQHAAASLCRCRRSRRSTGRSGRRRSSASTTTRRCASAAPPSPATPRRRDQARWSGSRGNCRAASASNGPASRCRRSSRARRRRCCWPCPRCWCSSCSRRSTRAGPFRSRCC